MSDNKRFYRQLKRDIKKDGNHKRRNVLKRALSKHPDEAHWDEYQFDKDSSEWLNGYEQREYENS